MGAVGFCGQVGEELVRVVEGAAQVVRSTTGLSKLVGGPVDDVGWVGVVVGPDSAGVLFVVEPFAELAEQLRQSTGHDGEFGDEPVEFGRFAQSAPTVGEVDERANGFGGVSAWSTVVRLEMLVICWAAPCGVGVVRSAG